MVSNSERKSSILLYIVLSKRLLRFDKSQIGRYLAYIGPSFFCKLGKLQLILANQGKCPQLMIYLVLMLFGQLVDQCYILKQRLECYLVLWIQKRRKCPIYVYLLTSSCVLGLRTMLKIFRLLRQLENSAFPFGIFCSTEFPIFT